MATLQDIRHRKTISVAHYPVNREKNRYIDVLPCEVLHLYLLSWWLLFMCNEQDSFELKVSQQLNLIAFLCLVDDTRVQLTSSERSLNNDYINASFIKVKFVFPLSSASQDIVYSWILFGIIQL